MLETIFASPVVQAMDKETKTAIIGFLGIVASALISWFAARYTAKKSAVASEGTVRVTERQVDVGEWKSLVESLQSEVKRIGEKADDLEAKDTAKREKINALDTKVTGLEQKLRDTDKKYSVALTYIRDLLAWTSVVFKSEQLPPPAPPEIADDL